MVLDTKEHYYVCIKIVYAHADTYVQCRHIFSVSLHIYKFGLRLVKLDSSGQTLPFSQKNKFQFQYFNKVSFTKYGQLDTVCY